MSVGTYSLAREGDKLLSPHFRVREFACRDGSDPIFVEEELAALLRRALADAERGLGAFRVDMEEEALNHLAAKADGDARKAITALEVAVLSTPAGEDGVIHVNLSVAEESIQRKAIKYDRLGDSHYDTISAFIKSMRGSDPDAALYWLAMMLEAGEDIRFIGRRLVIAASEDVGLADSNALRVALDAARAAEMIGMPEARIPLAHATVYLATAPKSNSAYMGINAAMDDVRNGKTLAVPEHLRTPTRKKLAAAGGADAARLAPRSAESARERRPFFFICPPRAGVPDKVPRPRPPYGAILADSTIPNCHPMATWGHGPG